MSRRGDLVTLRLGCLECASRLFVVKSVTRRGRPLLLSCAACGGTELSFGTPAAYRRAKGE